MSVRNLFMVYRVTAVVLQSGYAVYSIILAFHGYTPIYNKGAKLAFNFNAELLT